MERCGGADRRSRLVLPCRLAPAHIRQPGRPTCKWHPGCRQQRIPQRPWDGTGGQDIRPLARVHDVCPAFTAATRDRQFSVRSLISTSGASSRSAILRCSGPAESGRGRGHQKKRMLSRGAPLTFVARRGCRCWLRARRNAALRISEMGVLISQQSTPWTQGTESKRTRMITSGRAFHPIDEPSPPAAPRPALWTPWGTRGVCASRRPALQGWRRARSSRRLHWARTLAFRRLTHAPLSVRNAHEHLVHMPPAPLIGQLPARRTDGTLTHDCLP